MNKSVTLGILGVIACAMVIVLIRGMSSSPEETPLPGISPAAQQTSSVDTTEPAPLLADNSTPQTASSSRNIPTQTTQRLDTPAAQLPVPTPPVQPQPQQPAPQKPVPQPKPAPTPSVQSKPAETAPASTPATPTPPAKPEQTKPEATDHEPPKQSESTAPSLKPLQPSASPTLQIPTNSQSATQTASQDAGSVLTLSKMGLHFRGNDIYLRVEANGPFKTKVFTLTEPDRLVVDLLGSWRGITAPTIPANQLVTKVRIGQQPQATRLVLDLTRSAKYSVQKVSDSVIEITLQ